MKLEMRNELSTHERNWTISMIILDIQNNSTQFLISSLTMCFTSLTRNSKIKLISELFTFQLIPDKFV